MDNVTLVRVISGIVAVVILIAPDLQNEKEGPSLGSSRHKQARRSRI